MTKKLRLHDLVFLLCLVLPFISAPDSIRELRSISWLLTPSLSHAQGGAEVLSPTGVVMEWTRTYGVDMDRASELVTLDFREGKPKKTWADETGNVLRSVRNSTD